jgi:hypothetical protein
MLFGQAPCSAGWSKRRNVAYLGLLPAPQAGLSDITELYVARYGQPGVGRKVFIVTRQQKDGWEGPDQETNEIVPGKPADQQAAATGALSLQPLMHKGCSRDAQGTTTLPIPDSRRSGEAEGRGGELAAAAFGGGGAVGADAALVLRLASRAVAVNESGLQAQPRPSRSSSFP